MVMSEIPARDLIFAELRGLISAFEWINHKCNYSPTFKLDKRRIEPALREVLDRYYDDDAAVLGLAPADDWRSDVRALLVKWLFACGDLIDPRLSATCALLDKHSQDLLIDCTITKLAAVVEPCTAWRIETDSRYEFDCADMAFEGDDVVYILHFGWVD